jgi:hypothetical protein
MISVEKAVKDGFDRNPDLIKMPIFELARFFFIDGQLSYSNLLSAQISKTQFYRAQLTSEEKIKADQEWNKHVSSLKEV